MNHTNQFVSQKGGDNAPDYDDYDELFPPPPPYIDSEGRTVVPATAKFPVKLNGYYSWKHLRTLYLGSSAEQKQYAVGIHSGGLTGKKPQIILYDGLSDKEPVLAMSGNENWKQTQYYIKLPARDGYHGEVTCSMKVTGFLGRSYKLSIPVGGKGGDLEEFEWRSSTGEELKDMAQRKAYGFKLVRLGGPNTAGGSRSSHREFGFTSDGHEVVALLALNPSISFTKVFRFAFAGSGQTGMMGEAWERVALTSALHLWNLYAQLGAASSSSAGAAAAAAAAA